MWKRDDAVKPTAPAGTGRAGIRQNAPDVKRAGARAGVQPANLRAEWRGTP